MSAEHTSNAPHVGRAAQLYTELLEAKRLLANALAERDRLLESVKRHLADKLTLCEERDAALAERDRLLKDLSYSTAMYDEVCGEHDDLRDAARAFLALLDRHQFSSVALRGPELEALREACK